MVQKLHFYTETYKNEVTGSSSHLSFVVPLALSPLGKELYTHKKKKLGLKLKAWLKANLYTAFKLNKRHVGRHVDSPGPAGQQ